jgi:hypothetical protein
MRNYHHSFPGKILWHLAPITPQGVVHVYDQLGLTNYPPDFWISLDDYGVIMARK